MTSKSKRPLEKSGPGKAAPSRRKPRSRKSPRPHTEEDSVMTRMTARILISVCLLGGLLQAYPLFVARAQKSSVDSFQNERLATLTEKVATVENRVTMNE